MIKREKVLTFMERLYCDVCGEEMLSSGDIWTKDGGGTICPHVCKNQHWLEIHNIRYPKIVYLKE